MPGKVNPVIPEVVSQVAYAVAGADVTVMMAAENGQLQLNAFEPVIAHSLLQSITWMRQACWTLRVNCVDGITANGEHLEGQVGPRASADHGAHPVHRLRRGGQARQDGPATGRNVADLVVEANLMTREDVTRQPRRRACRACGPITQAIGVVERKEEPSD